MDADNPSLQEKHGKPVRILHSVGHLIRGGIETWLLQTIKALNPAHFEHHVLVRTQHKESFTDDYEKAGAKVIPCLDYRNPLKYIPNLRRVVRDHGPYEILHVHGSNPNGLMAILMAKKLGIGASIVHSHNDLQPLLRQRGWLYRVYVRLTLECLRRYSDRGIAVSALAAESMFGPNWQNDPRWTVVHCGMNLKPFRQQPDPTLRSALGIRPGAFVVGHVGRFHEQKNHELLVKIADAAIKKDRSIHFLLIGDGELRPKVTREIEQRNLQFSVTFVPDTKTVARYMRSAMDCFVMPSRYEGLPLAAVEAQAAGLPCLLSDRITTEVVLMPKLVEFLPVETGENLWAEAILRMRSTLHKADVAGEDEYIRTSDFNIERSALALGDVYRSVTSSRALSKKDKLPTCDQVATNS